MGVSIAASGVYTRDLFKYPKMGVSIAASGVRLLFNEPTKRNFILKIQVKHT